MTISDRPDPRVLRAQGCLLGQLAGDALGSQVEFMSPTEIRARYPNGVRDLVDGGTWDTLAGQPTDDSEMALALARALLRVGTYDPGEARQAHGEWLRSEPFDCGNTVRTGLLGSPNADRSFCGWPTRCRLCILRTARRSGSWTPCSSPCRDERNDERCRGKQGPRVVNGSGAGDRVTYRCHSATGEDRPFRVSRHRNDGPGERRGPSRPPG